MTTIYRTYESPFENRCFTEPQMKEVYRDLADKTEYPSFDIWLDDMLTSGVFEKYTAESLIDRYYDDYIHRALKTMTAYNIVIEILNKEMLSMNDKVVETLANEIYKTIKRFRRERLAGRNEVEMKSMF